jgi:thiol-disulfide isomerase/thioredoxin
MKVLKFGAVWCPGCLVMSPRWKEIEKDNSWLKTKYFDFDKDKKAVKKYNVDKNLPTLIFLDKEGKEFMRIHGEISKKKLEKIIKENKDK